MPPKVSGNELYLWRQESKSLGIKAGISPQEVDWLLQEISCLDTLALSLESFRDVEEIELKHNLSELTKLWQIRIQKRMPIQYLLGIAHWRHFTLKVSPDVLIPRPETELIIDLAIQASKNSPLVDLTSSHWVDLGTGSGAIAIGLAQMLPQAQIHATDISQKALAIAKENAQTLGFHERIQFHQGSWWDSLSEFKGKISAMISNPPYIPSDLISELQPEVQKHEPLLALDGGIDGLQCLNYLIISGADYLRSGGIWLVEMMAGQGKKVAAMLQASGQYSNIQVHSDLAGIDRFALAYRK